MQPEVNDLATWTAYCLREGRFITRNGRVTHKLCAEVWEVCGNFGVHYINPIACEIRKLESV